MNGNRNKRTSNAGFTLVEMVVSFAILAIIVAVSVTYILEAYSLQESTSALYEEKLLGDEIFSYLKGELTYAGAVEVLANDDRKSPEYENVLRVAEDGMLTLNDEELFADALRERGLHISLTAQAPAGRAGMLQLGVELLRSDGTTAYDTAVDFRIGLLAWSGRAVKASVFDLLTDPVISYGVAPKDDPGGGEDPDPPDPGGEKKPSLYAQNIAYRLFAYMGGYGSDDQYVYADIAEIEQLPFWSREEEREYAFGSSAYTQAYSNKGFRYHLKYSYLFDPIFTETWSWPKLPLADDGTYPPGLDGSYSLMPFVTDETVMDGYPDDLHPSIYLYADRDPYIGGGWPIQDNDTFRTTFIGVFDPNTLMPTWFYQKDNISFDLKGKTSEEIDAEINSSRWVCYTGGMTYD